MAKAVTVRITWGQIVMIVGIPLAVVSGVMHIGGASGAVKHLLGPMIVVLLIVWGAITLSDHGLSSDRDFTGRLVRAFTFFPPDEDELVSDVDTLNIVVAKANLERKDRQSTMKILDALRRRIQKDPKAAVEVVELGFLQQSLAILSTAADPNDPRIPNTFQVINVILNQSDARHRVTQDARLLKETVEGITILVEDITAAVRTEVMAACESEFEGADEREMQREVRKAARKTAFAKHGHKCLVTLGQLASDGEKAQTRLADAGAIRIILDCLKLFGLSEAFATWGFYALVSITSDHPSNKRDMVEWNGINVCLDTLRGHPDTPAVLRLGISLCWTIFSPDAQTKMNLPAVRQAAMGNGIVDIVQGAKRDFPEDQHLVEACDKMFEILISDFS